MTNNPSEPSVAWYRYPVLKMRQLYANVLRWSEHRHNIYILFALAFAESSFFPIPPDVLLMAMGLAKPKRSLYYATITSIGSVLGGLFGYAIGFYLWKTVSRFFIPHIFSQEIFDLVSQKYAIYSFSIVFIAAFTPIPYKVFTVTGGVCAINLAGFLAASAIGRSLRFFLVGTIFFFFGKKAKEIIDRYFEWLTILITILGILGFVLIKKIL